jgi:DNA-binding NarL/FixJ family response regulator
MVIKILLADDHKIMRDGLRVLLERQQDFAVAGEATDGHEAVACARQVRPDVVLMDIGMPGLNGMEATRQIRQLLPAVRVIALSMYSDKSYIVEMLKAGAAGYVLKDCAFDEVVRAVHTVAGGRTYLSPLVAGTVVNELHRLPADETNSAAVLTAREREILQLLSEGKTTKQIALLLTVSGKTVETHRGRIMDKLGIRTVPELTKYAIREGLTSLYK